MRVVFSRYIDDLDGRRNPTFSSVMINCMPSNVWVCYLICTHVLTSIILVNGKDGQDLFSSTANMKKLFAKEENVRGNRCTNLLTKKSVLTRYSIS